MEYLFIFFLLFFPYIYKRGPGGTKLPVTDLATAFLHIIREIRIQVSCGQGELEFLLYAIHY